MNEDKLIINSINAENIDLKKIMNFNIKISLSYVRGYIWRNYRIKIKHPLDEIILYMIHDGCIEQAKTISETFGNENPDLPLEYKKKLEKLSVNRRQIDG